MEKRTALYQKHQELGAKIIPFAGYEMPVRYTSDLDEHHCVRERVGIFDVSHMGEFMVEGQGALGLIQYVISNDASKLVDGKIQYACLPNGKGGIVDDLLVYKLADNRYMLVVNASNIDKDWEWINQHNSFGATLKNISDSYSLFAVQGPKAVATLQKLTSHDLSTMAYYTFDTLNFAGKKGVIVSATGYTGAGGFEVYIRNEFALEVWNKIMEAGEEYGIQPIGLGARDTLRLEKGYCLYGNDIDDTTSPIEAGLGWVTKFTKDFIDKEILLKQKESGVNRKLVGLKMIDKGIPRSHYTVENMKGESIGEITSGSISPVLGVGIAMGYLKTDFSAAGTEVNVVVRNRKLKAEVVKFPFV